METPDNIGGCLQFVEILADKVEKKTTKTCYVVVLISAMYRFPIPTVPWRCILGQLWGTKTVKGKYPLYKLHIIKHIKFLLLNIEVPLCSMRFLCVCTCTLLRFLEFSCIQVSWNAWNCFMTDKLHVEHLPQIRLYVKTLKVRWRYFYKQVKIQYSNSNMSFEQSLNFILSCIVLDSSFGIITIALVPYWSVRRGSYPSTMMTR